MVRSLTAVILDTHQVRSLVQLVELPTDHQIPVPEAVLDSPQMDLPVMVAMVDLEL
jgi:hypothetical protein